MREMPEQLRSPCASRPEKGDIGIDWLARPEPGTGDCLGGLGKERRKEGCGLLLVAESMINTENPQDVRNSRGP
jgi:hypothetical protein